jgi:hypothetical protein
VLVGPLDGKDTALVVVHLFVLLEVPEGSKAILVLNSLVTNSTRTGITSGGVVLGIEETVAVVAVGIALAIAIVGAAGVVLEGGAG